MGGAGFSSDIVMNISGENDAMREAYADQVIKLLNQIPEIQSAVRAQQAPGEELKFIPSNDNMFWGF